MTAKKDADGPRVLFFDVNETLTDLSGVRESVAKALGDKIELAKLWFETLLHYSLVVTVSGKFLPFDQIGAAALMLVARQNDITMTQNRASEAIQGILSAPSHPDVSPALFALKSEGFAMAALTNSARAAMERQLDHAGLSHFFDQMLSVEEIGIYKPHREVYHWAAKRMGIAPDQSMMIAAHGWDTAGALWAGMRAAFVARPGRSLYPLSPAPEMAEPDLEKIANRLIRPAGRG